MKQLYGVIGNPIGHSLSPLMHNDAFEYLNIDAHYHAFLVEEETLGEAVKGLKALGVSGFNVTTPHKVSIMKYLDEIDPLAKQIGAVNTVVHRDGKLIGYNTDGIGYVRSLQSISKEPLYQKRILLLGAGGACRAIYFSLADAGVKEIDIANRTVEKANHLLSGCQAKITSQALSLEQATEEQGNYDIIIHTTTIGMHPHIQNTPLQIQSLKQGTIVSDIIYNPFETKLLQDAKAKGAIVQNGIDMFVYQGALAFELWTGRMPNIEKMKQLVMRKLGG
ncbi:shikimate dehydrogenase [Bacillus pseudomycoides]|uniref:Shikimate dehydrogenase (NADP(+)) n=1 Tax=Bacillus pseudomycoides TaxID=64104 RepID=A0AAJ1YWJ4_9BACI|nr:shikimate dehydrogenase [Bacillus pseudomycoides]EEM03947.1 Shikimate dehydrogenase [Bacillus pseudomycoides]KFN16787.1 shikimate 5-dehydrogenase [Bacillus pseudomycoides]MDR4186781.1 shikimate dehydrogenase [Bacillus pseudomycoides]MDR4325904.1 shikimate dehydrogenase [Bacillus pseudomycoides]MED0853294.1 shikimate dehydrogenase [Bacillus pseudomycoides]